MKNRKWKILNRISCIFLAGVICSTAVFSSYSNTLQVYAADETPADKVKNIIHYVCSFLGYVPEAKLVASIVDLVVSGSMDLLNYFIFNDDGTVTVTEEGVSAIQGAVEENNDIKYYMFHSKPLSSIPDSVYRKPVIKDYLYKCASECDLIVTQPEQISNQYNICYDLSLKTYQVSDGVIYFYVCSSSDVSTGGYGISHILVSNWGTSGLYCGSQSVEDLSVYLDDGLVHRIKVNNRYLYEKYTYSLSGRSFMVFATTKDALKYYRGDYGYRGTSRYTGGPVSIPTSALNYNYDNIFNNINQIILGGGGFTEDDIQQIVDDAINDALDEIGDSSGDDSGNSGGSDEEEKPTSIEGWLEKIYKKLDDIYKQVKQIKWLSVADLIDDIVFNIAEIKNEFDPVVQTMMKKFPFSIPWDTALIFSLLADNPQAPHYEIPFVIESAGINETFEVDLERFEGLSKLSRGLLTLTFLMMLFALTRKIAQWFASNQK